MPTLDSIDAEVQELKQRMSSVESTNTSQGTAIQNLQVIQGQHTTTLNSHATRLDNHDDQLADHNTRLHTIEDSTLKITFTREGRMPIMNEKGLIEVYMPDKLLIEDFRKVNDQLNIAQDFNWFRKISNIVGAGKVCFDFDRDDGIKSIILGQYTRIVIPTGLKITELTPEKSTLKAVNDDKMVTEQGLCFGIEVVQADADKEVLLSICNYTNHTVHLYRGKLICSLAHLFQYKTNPVITTE